MKIFDEFIVVDEKMISEFTVQSNHNCNCSFRDVSQFAALQFMLVNVNTLRVTDIGNASSSKPNVPVIPLAQIVRWDWDKNGAQRIIQTHTLNKGTEINCAGANVSSIVIRILKKREKKSDEKKHLRAFPAPFSSSTDHDELTVKIGDKQIAVSAHWLMSVSPVISRMLSVEMREKQQRMITLDELGVDMDQFMEFLEAISDPPLPPNPTNVLMLLKLADYFQVAVLKSRCEKHLINCVEIPLIDRFLLIDRYGLGNLKNYFLHLDVNKLRAFFNANHEQFFPVISKEFLYALSVRLSEQ